MIVVSVLAIIMSIAMPLWNNYRIRSANGACLTEVSAYKVVALAALHDGVTLPVPDAVRCSSVSTAAIGTLGVPGVITATSATPGDGTITCGIAQGAACAYTSPSGN